MSLTDPSGIVTPPALDRVDFDAWLEAVRALAPGRVEGILGPSSVAWRIDREAAIFLGAGRALLLQLAYPWVAAAIYEHSRTFADPIGRFHRTFGVIFAMVFGSVDQALAMARRLHRRHAAIQGRLPADVGRFAAGSWYRANEIEALRWVHATLTDTAILIHELVLGSLGGPARERYYAESKLLAALFGIPVHRMPADWTAFAAYNEMMLQSEVLAVGAVAREMAGRLLYGAGTWLHPPRWYRAFTTHVLPARLREAFELRHDNAERELAEKALARIRRLYPALPQRLRYVGPYQEACARLRGRARPDLVTQALNRFWIGRPWLA
jgi:uncharacterized protein (DUF2236 family)